MKRCVARLLAFLLVLTMAPFASAEEEAQPIYANTAAFMDKLKQEGVWAREGIYCNLTGLIDSDGGPYADSESFDIYKFEGDERYDYDIRFHFSEDNTTVKCRVWDLICYAPEQYDNVLAGLNDLNREYGFVKFYTDVSGMEDGYDTVTCSMDIMLREGDDAGDIVFDAYTYMSSVIDEVYPFLVSLGV